MQSKSSERNSCMREGGCSLGTVLFTETFKNESVTPSGSGNYKNLPKAQCPDIINGQSFTELQSNWEIFYAQFLKIFTKVTSLISQTQKLKISVFCNALWEAEALQEVHMHSCCDLPFPSPQQWRKTRHASA